MKNETHNSNEDNNDIKRLADKVLEKMQKRNVEETKISRDKIIKSEKVILTYDAYDPFVQANLDPENHINNGKDIMLKILERMGFSDVYSPTRSTLIFNIPKGSFQNQNINFKSILTALPEYKNLFYSIACIAEGDNYDDHADTSLDETLTILPE